MDHLEDLKLSHGDVTPGNILLFDNTAKLSDFGFTREGVEGFTTLTVANSVWFAPPEFREGKRWGPKSDQFPLAATYLYLRIGGPPLYEPFGRPNLERVGSAEKRVLERAFAERPADRYPTSGEFARQLASVVWTTVATGSVTQPSMGSLTRSLVPPPDPTGWINPIPKPELAQEPFHWVWGWVKRLQVWFAPQKVVRVV